MSTWSNCTVVARAMALMVSPVASEIRCRFMRSMAMLWTIARFAGTGTRSREGALSPGDKGSGAGNGDDSGPGNVDSTNGARDACTVSRLSVLAVVDKPAGYSCGPGYPG